MFKGLYKRCECGRPDCLIPVINKKGRFAKFKNGHGKWNNGRSKCGNYWLIYMPKYFSSYIDGYILEHIYNFQEYYKCCLLPWAHIHHIEPVTKDYCNNMPWNLQGMMHDKHISSHQLGKPRVNTEDRRCYLCGSNRTAIYKDKRRKTPTKDWNHLPWDKINWYCKNCYNKTYKLTNKFTQILI